MEYQAIKDHVNQLDSPVLAWRMHGVQGMIMARATMQQAWDRRIGVHLV